MNREIKFRAFDIESKEMYQLSTLWLDMEYKKSIKIMQYIGLKISKREDGFDEQGNYKTNTELYEFDIVEFKRSTKFTLGKEVIGEKYVIVYQAELGGGFVLKHISVYDKQNGCNEVVNGHEAIKPYMMSNLVNHFEIIGNIYENPELLNEQI
jgi:hypothetical protein